MAQDARKLALLNWMRAEAMASVTQAE
jgi:hypothetical protein